MWHILSIQQILVKQKRKKSYSLPLAHLHAEESRFEDDWQLAKGNRHASETLSGYANWRQMPNCSGE